MRVLGVIPARGDRRAFPARTSPRSGASRCIAWSIEAARGSKLARVVVSTDDEPIAAVARAAGAEVPFLRPPELATDSARAIPVLQHALGHMPDEGREFDAVMMLQPTSPMRLTRDIDEAIAKLAADPQATSVISVVPVGEYHPARMKYLQDGCWSTRRSPRRTRTSPGKS